MSESVTAKKEVEIQVDYVRCFECGEDLIFNLESDSSGDLQITVRPCTCVLDND